MYKRFDTITLARWIVKELFKEESTYPFRANFEISLFLWIKKKTNVN